MAWNFENSNAGGFMDVTMSEGASDDKGGMKRGQNCIPVMISHLKRHGENITVWGVPARIATFVALVSKIESMSTKITFDFQDETGTIKGIKWLEGDNTSYESPVSINTYARVFGLIRVQNEEPYILILNVQPIQHVNELLAHLMEVTLMCLQGEKMVNKVAASDYSFANNTSNMNGSSMTGASNTGGSGTGLNSNQQLILEIIQNSDPEYGAERDDIKKRVPSYLVSKVDEIIEFLSGEGHIYTTKTDDFFKAI